VKEPLHKLVGARDVTHTPLAIATAPVELTPEVPATTAPFKGAVTLSVDKQRPLLPAQARKVAYWVLPKAQDAVPAGVRAIRTTGFQGIAVGIEHSFTIPDTPLEGLGTIALGGLALMFGVNPWSLRSSGPLSLDIPEKHAGLGDLRVVVPESAAPGHYAGRLEAEGNFAPASLALDFEVVSYEQALQALLDKRSAAEADLPVTALLKEARERKDSSVEVPVDDVGGGSLESEGTFGRWLVAGNGIWDLGMLQWVGPITDTTETGPAYAKVLAGPRDDPRLFFLNSGASVDVLSVRERRTIARLESPDGLMTSNVFEISPNGERVLVQCDDDDLCVFSHGPSTWSHQVLKSPCPFPTHCAWTKADRKLTHVLVGVGPQSTFATSRWQSVTRYEIPSGKRTDVMLDQICDEHAYNPVAGVLVAAVQLQDDDVTIALKVVRTSDMSVTSYGVESLTVKRLTVGDDGVISAETPDGCRTLTLGNPVKATPCSGDPFTTEMLVSGTSIRYSSSIASVTYRR
jgi:hypothetical protein